MSSDLDAPSGAGSGVAASPPRDNLYRATDQIGFERADDDKPATLTGHFALWDTWTTIRSMSENRGRPFLERFAPGSMTKTLSERTPKVLFQHGKDPQIGSKPLGAVARVEPDAIGAFYEVPLLDTTYNRDLIPGLEAGLYGASFQFSILHDDFDERPTRSEYNPAGIPERTVREAKVVEFGPVTFPAYAGATAGVRSLTDQFTLPAPGYAPSGVSLAGVGNAELWVRLSAPAEDPPVAADEDVRADEPEPSEAEVRDEPEPEDTTPETEPEPEATTHSNRGLFWFVDTPAHLKE